MTATLAAPVWARLRPVPRLAVVATPCRPGDAGPSVPRMGSSDAALVARLAAGDDHALAEVYDLHARAVYDAARRVVGQDALAQDVVQDVFVRLWTHPERFAADAGSLATYLGLMARSRALDLVRSELRRTARQEKETRLQPADEVFSVAEEVVGAEAARLVRRAIAQLPSDQRRVIELAYFRGLTHREVGLAEGIPEGTAKSRIRLAQAKLASLLDRDLLEQS